VCQVGHLSVIDGGKAIPTAGKIAWSFSLLTYIMKKPIRKKLDLNSQKAQTVILNNKVPRVLSLKAYIEKNQSGSNASTVVYLIYFFG